MTRLNAGEDPEKPESIRPFPGRKLKVSVSFSCAGSVWEEREGVRKELFSCKTNLSGCGEART